MSRVRDWYDDFLDGASLLFLAALLTAAAEEAQRRYLWPEPKDDAE